MSQPNYPDKYILPSKGSRSALLRTLGFSETEVKVTINVEINKIVTNANNICKSSPINLNIVFSHLMALKIYPQADPNPPKYNMLFSFHKELTHSYNKKLPKNACTFKPVSWSSVLQTSSKKARNGLSLESAEKSNRVTPIPTKIIAILGTCTN